MAHLHRRTVKKQPICWCQCIVGLTFFIWKIEGRMYLKRHVISWVSMRRALCGNRVLSEDISQECNITELKGSHKSGMTNIQRIYDTIRGKASKRKQHDWHHRGSYSTLCFMATHHILCQACKQWAWCPFNRTCTSDTAVPEHTLKCT